LVQMLNDTTDDLSSASDSLLLAYLTFNFDMMLRMASEEGMPANMDDSLINNRNAKMAKGFEKSARKRTTFCAVGAAHLAGEKGVLALLRKKGFTVEPVLFDWLSEEE